MTWQEGKTIFARYGSCHGSLSNADCTETGIKGHPNIRYFAFPIVRLALAKKFSSTHEGRVWCGDPLIPGNGAQPKRGAAPSSITKAKSTFVGNLRLNHSQTTRSHVRASYEQSSSLPAIYSKSALAFHTNREAPPSFVKFPGCCQITRTQRRGASVSN